MKKLFFATGIAIILIGFIVAYNYGNSTTEAKNEMVHGEYNVWQVSAYFKAGQYIHVYTSPAGNWTSNAEWDPPDDHILVNHMYIWFEILDPNGNITEYETGWTTENPSTGATVPLSICYVNVTIPGAAINTTNPQAFIGGEALMDGNYTVRIPDPSNNFYPGLNQQYPPPPYYLGLSRDYTVVTYPIGYLLPVGASIGVVGGVISIQSARSKKSTKHKKNNKK